jgi:hypothetical protein
VRFRIGIIEVDSNFTGSNQGQRKLCHDCGSNDGIGTAELRIRTEEGTLEGTYGISSAT